MQRGRADLYNHPRWLATADQRTADTGVAGRVAGGRARLTTRFGVDMTLLCRGDPVVVRFLKGLSGNLF
jgi:hypothetical protein